MDQTIIGELNQKYRIYYPYEEILIYVRDSKLSDSPMPAFTELFVAPSNFYPTKISFKSRNVKEGFPPDKTRSLIEFKRENPKVSYQKLEQLYANNFLAKYEWNEFFDPEQLSWDSLLSMCNSLVERSATDSYVFLRFSLVDPETIELITN